MGARCRQSYSVATKNAAGSPTARLAVFGIVLVVAVVVVAAVAFAAVAAIWLSVTMNSKEKQLAFHAIDSPKQQMLQSLRTYLQSQDSSLSFGGTEFSAEFGEAQRRRISEL